MARQLNRSRPTTRVFLVDDEPMLRRGLRLLLGLEPDLEVCGEAATEREALEEISTLQPDLAIVDLSLREGEGLALIRSLSRLHPALKILVFSMHDQVHFAASAFTAGARGYVTKEEGTERVLEAIQALIEGGYYLSEQVAAKVPGRLFPAGPRYPKQPL